MLFRLTTLLYLFALLAASAAVMGTWGLLAGLWIFWGWTMVERTPSGKVTCLETLVFVAVFFLGPMMYFPAYFNFGNKSGLNRLTVMHLKQLSLAIRQYEQDHGTLPPPYVADDQGGALFSWRVLLLPYLDSSQLANQFRHDEPWDSPHNHSLLYDIPWFRSPRGETAALGETHFVAVVGPGTVWDPSESVSLDSISDGRENTLLLVEIPSRGIAWSEPRDLTIDEAIALFCVDPQDIQTYPGYFVSSHYRARTNKNLHMALADGSVRRFPPHLEPDDLRALLTPSGGEVISFPQMDYKDPPPELVGTTIHWYRFTNLLLWLAVVLLPTWWLRDRIDRVSSKRKGRR